MKQHECWESEIDRHSWCSGSVVLLCFSIGKKPTVYHPKIKRENQLFIIPRSNTGWSVLSGSVDTHKGLAKGKPNPNGNRIVAFATWALRQLRPDKTSHRWMQVISQAVGIDG